MKSNVLLSESLFSNQNPEFTLSNWNFGWQVTNGSEFSNPKAIESDREGVPRTRVFYCDPASPHQKGSAERNHELIRLCIPKGIDFGRYSPEDIALMMDHINSYARPSLGDKCPYDTFAWFYGRKILDVLGCHKIPPQEIKLNRTLFSKEDDAG